MKVALALLVSLSLAHQVLGDDCEPASMDCNPDNCELPDCSCSDDKPDLPVEDMPQLVFLTFDDAFTALAEEKFYRGLFDGTYTNPNDCPIRATHFLSARSMDYSLAHEYWTMGHEMASHSITHRYDQTYWKGLNKSQWADELMGMKKMINIFANIPLEDIRGVRAPFLQGGGDEQFFMLEEFGFYYDCTMPSLTHGYTNLDNGRWPYTTDYRAKQNCQIPPCPICSHPGIWVQPLLDLEDNNVGSDEIGFPCAMLDSCIIPEETAEATRDMLRRNFDRSYNGKTRAPFGLYTHAAWFFGAQWRYDGYKMFIEDILQLPDVWIVPVRNGIEYKKAPATNEELIGGALTEFFGCDNYPPKDCVSKHCKFEHVENEDIHDNEEYIAVCGYCPNNYPWLGNPEGN